VKFTPELRDATCQMGSHSVICYPTEVAAPPSPQPDPQNLPDIRPDPDLDPVHPYHKQCYIWSWLLSRL